MMSTDTSASHTTAPTTGQAGGSAPRASRPRFSRLKLLGILAVCAAPVIASYFTYYVIRPEGRTNYGELIVPQRAVTDLPFQSDAASPVSLERFRGKWVLLVVGQSGCEAACANRLYLIRQLRLTTGRDRDRIERALVLTDDSRLSAELSASHDGLVVGRAPRSALGALETPAGGAIDAGIYVIDPLGNLMMRFPADGDANKMKRDIGRLLKASRIG
jgi:cytochrome oxidase Cu insertion factor (SCO1/SenC/PrrC family)